jgi:RNA polymerase sigma-70 factor (ECF subfamily)
MNVLENEPQLTLEACTGSTAAFEALVVYYEPRIRRMLYSLTQDSQLTQDLCQETFLAAYRALPRMNGDELRFAPWLYRIALNQVRSEWRRRKHVSIMPFALPQGNDDDVFDDPVEESLISGEYFEEQVVQRDLIDRVMAQLPPSSAMCLLLDAEGFSYREIAETLQDSLSAVRSRLSRARQSFQRLYRKLEQEGR